MKPIFAVALLAVLAGCVEQPYRPIVDSGKSTGDYETDLAQCKQIASQVPPPGQQAAGGAVAGAIIGALIGAAVGLNSRDTGRIAAYGAVAGGVNAAAAGSVEWTAIVNRCMAGRGYNVLN